MKINIKELHPGWNSGKQVYLYQIKDDKFVLKEVFSNTCRAHETLGISRTTLWKYLNNNIIIYSNVKAPKKKDFFIGKIKNPLYVGKFIVTLQKLDNI